MAPTGQGATQAPQPLQAERSICGGAPATLTAKRMALAPQASPQARQMTPEAPRQFCATAGRPPQALRAAADSAPLSQASTQSLQNVHSPRAKSTCALLSAI